MRRANIKNIFFVSFFLILCFSCKTNTATHKISKDEKLEILKKYLVAGATIEDQRPMIGILSEQEVLIKAAEYAINEGVLDPSYYIYDLDPGLRTAKIETPILIYNPDGSPCNYVLAAVDTTETFLLRVIVKSEENIGRDDFLVRILEPFPNRDNRASRHIITKREVKEFIERRFPGQNIDEPVAITGLPLEGSLYSKMAIFWYFKVANKGHNPLSTFDEYLIDSFVSGGYSGSPFLGGARMVKLLSPLSSYKIEPLKYIAVTLE